MASEMIDNPAMAASKIMACLFPLWRALRPALSFHYGIHHAPVLIPVREEPVEKS